MVLALDNTDKAIKDISSSKAVKTSNLEEELAIAEGKLVRIDDYKNLKDEDKERENNG